MNFGFYCLNGFLLGKTGSNISPDGTDITADLLVNIIGAVGSWNLGDPSVADFLECKPRKSQLESAQYIPHYGKRDFPEVLPDYFS